MLKFKVQETPFLGVDGKYYYIYKTTNIVNNKIYIGCRCFKGKNPMLDEYLGCGVFVKDDGEPKFMFENKNSNFVKAVREEGCFNFNKQILLFCGSKEMLLNVERMIVNDEFVSREDTYNMVLGGGNPPTGSGIKNNNAGNRWNDDQKRKLSEKRKLLKRSSGANNAKACACVLYDFLKDESFNLSYIRECWEVVGEKLDINWVGLMKYRYFLHLPNENPYEKALSLKKPKTTLAILECIKKGLTKEQAIDLLKSKNIKGSIVSRTYKNIVK